MADTHKYTGRKNVFVTYDKHPYYSTKDEVLYRYGVVRHALLSIVSGIVVVILLLIFSPLPNPSGDWGIQLQIVAFALLSGVDIGLAFYSIPRLFELMTQERTGWKYILKTLEYLDKKDYKQSYLDVMHKMAENDRGGVQVSGVVLNSIWPLALIIIVTVGQLQVLVGLAVIFLFLLLLVVHTVNSEQDAANVVILQALTLFQSAQEEVTRTAGSTANSQPPINI